MYTGNVWGIALFIAGFLATLISFQLLLGALFANRSLSALRTLRERPVGAGVAGAVTTGLVVLVAIVLGQLGGPGKFASALTLSLGSIGAILGLGVVSRFVGERMPSPADDGRSWRVTLRGGVTCGLAFALPLVGWFVVLPASLVFGTGAVVLSAFARAPEPSADTAAVPGAAA